jgi:hypothetical protein
MPKICYVKKKFRSNSLEMINSINAVINRYKRQGLVLTLRQLYYQFVSKDLFPDDRTWSLSGDKWKRDPNGTKNAEPNYKWLGDIVNNGRLAGLIDWEAIEDRTRNLHRLSSWGNPNQIVDACANQYRRDLWENQPHYVEVWVEKEALSGVFITTCNLLRVPLFACKGYVSQSEQWSAAQRLAKKNNPVILHFGDHDPSGIDMTRDITSRLTLFGAAVEVRRIALNMDQIQAYNPPPNPAKSSDTRYRAYQEEFGDESWELDALDPAVLRDLVSENVSIFRDEDQWKKDLAQEEDEKASIQIVSKWWGKASAAAWEAQDEWFNDE